MGRLALLLLLLVLAAVVAAMGWQHHRYLQARRDVVHDRQPLLHGSVLHVVLYLELAPGAELLDAVRALRDAAESTGGGRMVYAGKVAVNALTSAQLTETFGEEVAWDAVVLLQLPSREAWDRLVAGDAWATAMRGFARRHAQGMQRSAWLNLAIPMGLLAERARQIVTRAPSHFPFEPAPPEERVMQADGRLEALLAERELGRDAVVVANLLRAGTPEQQAADRAYGLRMLGLMAEGGHGPMHMGRAVTLEGEATFDRVALVYYPGVDYFAEMARSRFYQGIVGGKQPGDTQASVTVPILHRL